MLNDIYESSSNWLKADDIRDHRPIVTIESAVVRENTYNGETKKQIVLTFKDKSKQLGLNFTNAAKIASLLGTEDYEQWVGHSIKLYTEKVKFENRMVDAIRIFPELPPQSKAVAAPAPNSESDSSDDCPF